MFLNPFTTLIGVSCDINTGNPDLITITSCDPETGIATASYEFPGPEGAALATNRLLNVVPWLSTPYGIFEPSGIVEVSYSSKYPTIKRFYFDPINYLSDSLDSIFIQLDIRFRTVLEWRAQVTRQ